MGAGFDGGGWRGAGVGRGYGCQAKGRAGGAVAGGVVAGVGTARDPGGFGLAGGGRKRGSFTSFGRTGFWGGELACLPEQEKLFQTAEDAREGGQNQGVQRPGQPTPVGAGCDGGVEAGEAGGQRGWLD